MTYDMREAISKIDSIPLVKESIPELTKLANGFDPSIPGYLALGRLHQITSLAESAQTAKPPQGTIKDKTTQAAGLMALMGGRGQMAAQNSAAQTMNQAGPVPQNTPEPEMQTEANPEEMMGMGMADGGITSMDIDPRMFNFDGGGIVTFANPEKEKKQQVKEKDKDEETSSTIGRFFRDLIAPLAVGDSVYKAGQAFGTDPGLFEQLTESQRAARERAAEEIRNPTPKVSPEEMAKRNEQNRLRALFEAQYQQGNTASSPNAGTPLISPAMQKATNMQPPAPPKPPMGGINDGKMPVPGANIPAIGAGTPQAMPENKFLTATEKFIGQQPEVFNEAAETAKINARNEAAGIGTYAKIMREQQQGMRDQFERSRPTLNEDIVGMLRRYARPGAMAGDVGDEANTQMRTDREARMQFAQDQFKVTEAIERLEEARRTGNVDKIAAAEAAVKKANADLRNHQMTAAASAASTLGHTQSTMAQIASHEKIEAVKAGLEKLKIAAMNKEPQAVRVMHEVEALMAAGKTKEAEAKLELFGKVNAATQGAKYQGKSTAPTETQIRNAIRDQHKLENQFNFMTLAKKNAKPAEKAAAQAAIDATEKRIREEMTRGTGGGGAVAPDQRAAAEQWLKDNPNDPRAAAIRQRLAGG